MNCFCISNTWSKISIIVILVSVFTQLFQINDEFFIVGIILSFLTAHAIYNIKFKITPFDYLVIGLLIFEIISLFSTLNVISNLIYLQKTYIAIIIYFISRIYLRKISNLKFFLFGVSLIFIVSSVLSLFSFLIFETSITLTGSNELHSFKNLYSPLGFFSNDWAAILGAILGFLGLTLYYFQNHKKLKIAIIVAFVPIIFGLILSFSRGAYISLILQLIIAFYLVLNLQYSLKKRITICLLMIVGIVILILPYYKEVATTIRFSRTISQQRSIDGRVEAGQIALKIFKKNPLFGFGGGNYSLCANEYRYENDNNTFTTKATSTITQLIVEKGIIGTFLWFSIILVIIVGFIKEKKTKVTWILISVLLALILKEITFSTFFDVGILQIMFFILIAIYQNHKFGDDSIYLRKRKLLILPIVLLIISGSIFVFSIQHFQDEQNNNYFLEAIKEKQFVNAQKYIEKTRLTTPYLINRGLLEFELYKKNRKIFFLQRAEVDFRKAISQNPKDFLVQHNLAIILYHEGKTDSCLSILKELSLKFPENYIYHLSLGEILYKRGNKKEALQHFIMALELNPILFDEQLWITMKSKDRIYSNLIAKILKNRTNSNIDDPILLSKRGKILLSIGDTLKARIILEKAVLLLPNLTRPWLNIGIIALHEGNSIKGLACIRKSYFLNSHDFLAPLILSQYYYKKGDNLNGKLFYLEATNDIQYLNSERACKFKKWYDSKTLSNDIIPVDLSLNVNFQLFQKPAF